MRIKDLVPGAHYCAGTERDHDGLPMYGCRVAFTGRDMRGRARVEILYDTGDPQLQHDGNPLVAHIPSRKIWGTWDAYQGARQAS